MVNNEFTLQDVKLYLLLSNIFDEFWRIMDCNDGLDSSCHCSKGITSPTQAVVGKAEAGKSVAVIPKTKTRYRS